MGEGEGRKRKGKGKNGLEGPEGKNLKGKEKERMGEGEGRKRKGKGKNGLEDQKGKNSKGKILSFLSFRKEFKGKNHTKERIWKGRFFLSFP